MSVFMARTRRRAHKSLRMRSAGYTTQGRAAEAGRSGSGVQVWGWLSVWIPQIGVRESRDVTLYEGTALTMGPPRRSKM